jgi:hypothetical protein
VKKTKGHTWRMRISFSRASAVAEIAPVVGVRRAGTQLERRPESVDKGLI